MNKSKKALYIFRKYKNFKIKSNKYKDSFPPSKSCTNLIIIIIIKYCIV